jgi:hypothetical protein
MVCVAKMGKVNSRNVILLMATELLGRQWERRSLRPVEARADNPWFDLQSLDFTATGRPAQASPRIQSPPPAAIALPQRPGTTG